MPLREDLLRPIPGDNPSGVDLRYDSKTLVRDKIKEARRQDDDLAQGDWQHERKLADFPAVLKLAQESLATQSKDLQLAAWITEALVRTEGFPGLRQGLNLCHELTANFWDTLYPPIEDGDLEARSAPLEWVGTALGIPLKSVRLTKDGFDFLRLKESKLVGYEETAQSDKDKKTRAQRLAEGKLAPEVFDKSFAETPKAYYLQSEKELDACLAALKSLDDLCNERFTNSPPSFSKLQSSLTEVRHAVHTLLEKKRETEPDPVEAAPTADSAADEAVAAAGPAGAASTAATPSIVISVLNSSEPPLRRDAIASVAKAAAYLRKQEPYSPAPYLMMRGLRWGELRAAANINDATLLEAPSTELRQHIKRLALGKKWDEVLETAENAMSLPCSRAWLDLQRFTVDACSALGTNYDAIANAIRTELRGLVKDLPQLLDANLLDDTPAANAETKAWLKGLVEAPSAPAPEAPPPAEGEVAAPPSNGHLPAPAWPARGADSYALAQQALKDGQPDRAFEIMQREITRQRSGRGKFERTLQLVQLCVSAGKDAIAQPLLEDLTAAIETHKLDDWEDKQMVAAALHTVMTVSKKIQGNAGEKQKLFDRICRLDPVRALNAG